MSNDVRKMNFRQAPRQPWKYTAPKNNKNSVGGVLFGAAVVFLSITLISLVFLGFNEYREHLTWYNYHEEEDDLLRKYNYENYPDLLTGAYDDANIDRKYTETELKLHAVAEYYEAATLVRAFEAAGDETRAAVYRQKMADLPDEMGEFADAAEKIDKIVFGE